MTQPTRWLEDENTSREIRELLRAGSRPPHFPRALLLASVVPLAHKTALASSWVASSTAMLAIKATSVGLVIGLGSIAAVTTVGNLGVFASKPAEKVPPPTAVHGKAPPRSAHVADIAPVRVIAPEPSSAREAVPKAAIPASIPPAQGAAMEAPKEPVGIAAEAGLLERARSVLDQSPARALILTDEHRTRYAAGQLIAERELIAIDALLRLGRLNEALQRAKPYLTDPENQIFAERLRNLLSRYGQ